LTLMAICLPQVGAAQVMLVCQTPGFWCSIPAPYAASNESCWCNSLFGPVWGYTIIPFNMSAPTQPQRPGGGNPPLSDTRPGGTPSNPPPDMVDLTERGAECFDGLGNCQGAFQ